MRFSNASAGALFSRRFFSLATCVAFTWWDLKGIILVVFFWGVWHGMMQTYGFCRIYDAKMGSFAALTRRLDFATCAIWFAAAVLLSPERMTDTLETFYASGGPYIGPDSAAQRSARRVSHRDCGIDSVCREFCLDVGEGKTTEPGEAGVAGNEHRFWWYCNNGVANILAGIALFEVFHDVQYLSLVWIYNRNRVEKDKSIGGFMRFVFRRSGSLVGLYIGLVFAYGSLGYFKDSVDVETIKRVLTGVVAASGLLHFYYDGFIWKVRERSTRESLGLAGGTADIGTNNLLPGWMVHGLKWVAIFVIPLGALWIGQTHSGVSEVQRGAWVVSDLPNGKRAHQKYGIALQDLNRFEEAAQQYRAELEIDPNIEEAHYGLGHVLLAQSKIDEASKHIEQALRSNPRNGDFHSDHGYLLESLGQKDEARNEYQAAIRLSPKSPRVHYNYAMFLGREGKIDEAITEFEKAVKYKPDYADAHYDLANAFFVKNDFENAKSHYLATLRADPNRATAYNNLGLVFLRQGQISQAIAQFNEALRVKPDDSDAAQNLRLARAQEPRF